MDNNNWQPPETAPRDGTRHRSGTLVLAAFATERVPLICRYVPRTFTIPHHWVDDRGRMLDVVDSELLAWMPAPAMPVGRVKP